ncbi:aluminum-activated malate transporter 10-like [Senna tora]|uniref:Aluminum-activated malate transporter 10-like n=1 Tax=Senna tora TaxID=362788 RepID=A0A834SVG8_9FABA|nr:aluminum-activated malate transporter 10-like [Senna tora]
MGRHDNVEWRVTVAGDGSSSEILVPEVVGFGRRIRHWIVGLGLKLWRFLKKAWEVGVNDPRKFVHCIKVGIALTVVSLFYYVKPLYDGVGGNAMWAVMTVVVVFEYTAGATISKTINRICGTSLAGFLAIGVHWVASRAGDKLEPLIVGVSLFLLASAATFSRFIPTVKARFDYGAMIFILTFSLVSVSGYRVDELLGMAQQRLSTIIIGTSLCIIVSTIISPIWAGQELYVLITTNMDKLANSLDGCVTQYFSSSKTPSANFARWEPAHGRFSFRHPWKQYLKVGASMRSCASCIDALVGCINLENKASDDVKEHISGVSLKLSAKCGSVIREVANTIRNMTKSSRVDTLVGEMNSAAQELQDVLKSYPIIMLKNIQPVAVHDGDDGIAAAAKTPPPPAPPPLGLMELVQLVTVASLLIEIVARVEAIVNAVQQLADSAHFSPAPSTKPLHPIISSPSL